MNLAQMTSDASGLTGTNPTAPVNTTREGDWFQPPCDEDDVAYASHTVSLTPPAGLHDLFLVFRQAPDGPGSNFFNLNWVEFGGAGVGT